MNGFKFLIVTLCCMSNMANCALQILSEEEERCIKEVIIFGYQDRSIRINQGLKNLSLGAVEMFGVMPPPALEEMGAEANLQKSTDVYQHLLVQVNIPTAISDCLRYRVRNRNDISSLICLVKEKLHIDGALHEVQSIEWMFVTKYGEPSDQGPAVILDYDATLQSLRARV